MRSQRTQKQPKLFLIIRLRIEKDDLNPKKLILIIFFRGFVFFVLNDISTSSKPGPVLKSLRSNLADKDMDEPIIKAI